MIYIYDCLNKPVSVFFKKEKILRSVPKNLKNEQPYEVI